MTSCVTGQTTPPWAFAVKTERVRLFVPVPQDLEQDVYALQVVTLQSIGHMKVLQVAEADKVGHALPPC